MPVRVRPSVNINAINSLYQRVYGVFLSHGNGSRRSVILFAFFEKSLYRFKKAFCILNILIVIFGLSILVSENHPSEKQVVANYVISLKKFEGTSYVWGGENFLGIDCSDLMRRSFILGLLKTGVTSLNFYSIKRALHLWAFDCSAYAIKEEYRGFIKKLFIADSINKLDHKKIRPGDMAVTYNGVHILAYLGDKIWIQADPAKSKVIKSRIPSKISWYDRRVVIVRWNI